MRLDDLEFQQVAIQSDQKLVPRYNHTAAQFGSRLVIFGGMRGDMNFLMDAQEIEFDPEKVSERVGKEAEEHER